MSHPLDGGLSANTPRGDAPEFIWRQSHGERPTSRWVPGAEGNTQGETSMPHGVTSDAGCLDDCLGT